MDQAALLELLAGKRNASVLAAILQSPEELKAAYEDAQNAEGSALKENEKYMDSIQGRIDQFNNALQTMWKNTLDDDVVKMIVNLGTELIKLIDTLGLIPSILIAISSVSIMKNKLGPAEFLGSLLNTGKDIVSNSKKWLTSMYELGTGVEQVAESSSKLTQAQLKEKLMQQGLTDAAAEDIVVKTKLGRATDELSEATLDAALKEAGYGEEQRKSIASSILDTQTTDANTVANNANAQSSMNAGAAEDKDTVDTMENVAATQTDTKITNDNTAANNVNATSSTASGAAEGVSKTATIVSNVVGGATTAATVVTTTKAVGGLTKVIGVLGKGLKVVWGVVKGLFKSNWVGWILMAIPLIVKLVGNIKSTEERLTELKEGWESLHSTIKETSNEFRSLKKDTDDIISKYSELSQGVNKYGENISLTDEEYEEFISLNEKLAELFPELVVGTDAAGNSILSLSGDVDTLTESLEALIEQKRIEAAEKIADTMPDVMNNLTDQDKIYQKEKEASEKRLKNAKTYLKELQELYSEEHKKQLADVYGPDFIDPQMALPDVDDLQAIFPSPEAWQAAISAYTDEETLFVDWEAFINGPELQSALTGAEKNFEASSERIEAHWKKLNNVVSEWMLTDFNYQSLSDEGQSIADQIVQSMDFSSIDNLNSAEDVHKYVLENIINPLEKVGPEVQAAAAAAFDIKAAYDKGDMSAGDYQAGLNQWLNKLEEAGLDEKTVAAMKVSLDFGDFEDKINTLRQTYGDAVNDLSAEELEIAYKIIQDDGSMSFEDLKQKIDKIKFDQADMVNALDFSDMVQGLDKAKSGMDSLISAMGKLRDGTALTKSELAQLAFEYPKLLESSNLFTDGSVKGQQNMLNAILDMTEQEYDAQIDAKIAELEATQEVLQDQLDLEAEKAQLLQDIENLNVNGIVEQRAELVNKISKLNDLQGQNYVNMEEGILTVNQEALNKKATQEQEFGEKATTNIWQPYANVIKTAHTQGLSSGLKAFNSYATQLKSGVASLGNMIGTAWNDIWAGEWKGFKHYFSGIGTDVSGGSAEISFDGGNAFVNDQILDDWISNQNEASDLRIQQVKEAMQKNLNAINNLESLKGLDLDQIYADSSKSGGDSDKGESDFDKYMRDYEEALAKLEHQKELVEGQIDILEAQEQGVSNGYYKQIIDVEDQKMKLYEGQLELLKELAAATSKTKIEDGKTVVNEEWYDIADQIREIEKAMQDTTLAAIEAGKAMVENWTNAADKIKEAYDNFHSLADLQKESRENYAGLLEAQGHYTTKRIYDEQNAIIQGQRDANKKQFDELYSIYEVLERGGDNPFDPTTEKDKWDAFQTAAEKGVIAVHQELATLKNQDIAWATEQEENINAWKDTIIEAFDAVREAYANQHQFIEDTLSMTESYISRMEAWNINIPDAVIEDEIDIQASLNISKENDLNQAIQDLEYIEKEVGKEDQRYVDAANKVIALRREVYEGETKVLELEQQILDNQFDRFNQVLDRIDDAIGDLDHASNLIADEDVATEDGKWTAEGITRAGFEYQKMEYYKQNIEKINAEIAHYDELLQNNQISEKEHYEKTKALEDQLWNNVDAYKASEDAIVDLNEARIDMIENGLNEEIEAYSELINLKKSELDAERDLFEFRREVEDQSKNIAEIERRMASISSSSSAEDRAEYKRLQKELYDANRGLDDTYRDHSYDQTSQALDEELEIFEKNYENYIEGLREEIKNTDELIKQTYADVVTNGQVVLETITQLSDEYGIQIDGFLVQPWINARTETLNLNDSVVEHMSAINQYVETSSGELSGFLKSPYDQMMGEDGTLADFTKETYKAIQGVREKAEGEQEALHNGLYNGFLDSEGVVGTYQTGASNAIQAVINKSIEAKNKIGEAHTALNAFLAAQAEASVGDAGGGGGGGGDKTPNNPAPYVPPKQDPPKTTLRALMQTSKETILGSKSFVDSNTETINGIKYYRDSKTGYYYKISDLNSKRKYDGGRTTGWAIPKGTWFYTKHAKGTLATKKDEWAITDEPQYGDELVLVPSAAGNLSFMRKGTGVVPAELTKRIMEIAQMPASELGNNIVKAVVPNIETTHQAVQVNFEALVKADNITNDVLPEVEKLVAKQLNTFTKNLNYSLKKVGGR